MSKITFTTLEVENYSCIENAIIPLDKAKTCLIQEEKLIEGEVENEVHSNKDRSNGTGKTSLLESFFWCITGEFFDPGTTMATVLNRFTEGDTVVKLHGYKDNVPFKIERTLSAKSKRVGAKVTHDIKFIVDNENIHDKTSSITQTQDTINTFLATNPLLLLNSRIIGQGEISSFTKVNDRQKKILIDNLVGLGICDKYLGASKKLYSETCTSTTALDIELNNLQSTITRLERDKNTFTNNHADWEDTQNKIVSDAANKLAAIDKQHRTTITAIALLDTSIQDVVNQTTTYLNYSDKLIDAQQIGATIDPVIINFKTVVTKIDNEHIYYQRRINEGMVKLEGLNLDFEVCPTCKQKVDESHIQAMKMEIQTEIANDTTIRDKIYEKKLLADKELEVYITLKKETTSTIKKFSDGVTVLDGLKRTIESKNNELYKLNLDKKALEQERETHTQIATEGRKKSESSPFLGMIDTCNKEIEAIKVKIKDKLEQQAIHNEEKAYYGIISRAFDKDGIPKLVSTDALGIINGLIKRYTTRIFGNKFKLELKAKPRGKSEEIYPDIDNPEGGLTYARQSGGERKDIDLCQQFALREFARMQDKSNFNVEFFDEVFAELDNHTSELFLDIIFEGDTENIFIITHKDMCKEYFRNNITVKKKGSTSTVHVNFASVNEESPQTLGVE